MDTSSFESGSGSEEYSAGVRLAVLNLPEDEGEGLGFRLTRTLWDPYPWVREVTAGSRADSAGLKMGDCLLQADGKDLLGMPVGQVAGLIRGDGAGRGVSLLVWNCGVDPKDDPELLWSCGGGARGERARRALAGVVRALACCVCAATATRALSCARSHVYCEACWSRLERCALCRETLPAKDSPYARNLVAEQVFEAIATEYEIKDTIKRTRETVSAYTSPNRSPNTSPAANRRGQYQMSMMNRKKAVQFNELQNYSSDPSLNRTLNNHEIFRRVPNSTNKVENLSPGNSGCGCQNSNLAQIPQIKVEDTDCDPTPSAPRLVAVRQACSLADLQTAGAQSCQLSRSLTSLRDRGHQTASLESLKSCHGNCETPVYVLSAPPIYVLACDHNKSA